MNSRFFGFRTTFLTVGILHVVLSCLMFLQGITPPLRKFGVPDIIVDSPHYYDAMLFVFYHQFVIGSILVLVALFAREPELRVWLTRILSLLYCVYTYLDFRVSDSIFGNRLYQGVESLVPPLFTLLFTVLILQLNLRKAE